MNDRFTLSPDAAAAAFDRFVKKPSPGAPPPHIELFDENGRMLNIADDPFVGGYTVALLEALRGAGCRRRSPGWARRCWRCCRMTSFAAA